MRHLPFLPGQVPPTYPDACSAFEGGCGRAPFPLLLRRAEFTSKEAAGSTSDEEAFCSASAAGTCSIPSDDGCCGDACSISEEAVGYPVRQLLFNSWYGWD